MKGQRVAAIVIRDQDNVGTATRDIKAGEKIEVKAGGKVKAIVAKEDIRFLHKFALTDIARGERVFKYGATIGEATKPISEGEHVHVHNLRSLWGRGST